MSDQIAEKYTPLLEALNEAGHLDAFRQYLEWCAEKHDISDIEVAMEGLSWFAEEHNVTDIEVVLKIIAARDFSVEGYVAFHELIYGLPLTDHMLVVITQIMESSENDRGTVIELFRGAAKTTSVTIGFVSWMIGLNPDKTFLIIQDGDAAASKNGSQIARIIEFNQGFHMVFPHVVPDKEAGWGEKAYYVKITHKDFFLQEKVSYEEWIKERSKRSDPSFVALGYRSQIIGRRPWFLLMDDMNNEANTISARELRTVKTRLKGTIFPAANQSDFNIYIGTPWNEADALHYCLQTGLYDHVKIPVYNKKCLDCGGEEIDLTCLTCKSDNIETIYTWEDMYGEKEVEKERKKAGDIEFARMFLLDLEKTKGLILKKKWLHSFENRYINLDWPVWIGVDYTSTEDPRKEKGDYFALAVGRELPGFQGMVLCDGVRERLSQAEAEDMVIAWAVKYPGLLRGVGVEAILQGSNFYNDLLANAEMRKSGVIPIPIRFSQSKGFRFEKQMAPLFQKSRVQVSDAENEFLTLFREEWVSWQGDPLEDAYHNDTLDAVYSMLRAAEHIVTALARPRDTQGDKPFIPKKKKKGAFNLSRT
jgi:hypothetical protein